MTKRKKKCKLPSELADILNDEVQMDTLSTYVMEEDVGTDVFRSIWRRLFPKVVPPWIITEENKEKLENPGPYAIKGLLTGELCVVCDRPLYLTPNQEGITCAGGHSEEQRKKKAKELLDDDGEYITSTPSKDLELDEDEDEFFD